MSWKCRYENAAEKNIFGYIIGMKNGETVTFPNCLSLILERMHYKILINNNH